MDFGAKYTKVAGEIREARDAKDLKQAHSLIHNLKGLAGNLAATDHQAAAVETQKLVKGEQNRIPSAERLNQKFTALENAINQGLASVLTIGVSIKEETRKRSDDKISDIPPELVSIQKLKRKLDTKFKIFAYKDV